jgi:ribose transport system substrate-binding protein
MKRKSTMRNVKMRRFAACAISLLVITTTACSTGTQSGNGANVSYNDTGTFNEPQPNAPKVEGPKLGASGQLPADKPIKIGVLIKSLTNQYWQEVEKGINQAKTDLGVQTSTIMSAQSETNTQEQLQICQTMLLENYDAFIVSPQTTSNLNPCITQMREQNIPVVNIAAPGQGLVSTVYVGSALVDDGRLAGEYLAKTLPPGSKVAEIQGLPGSSAADLRTTGFKSAIEKSGLTLVASESGDWDEQKAYQRAQDLLSRHRDLKGIYAANDTMATAVARAAHQAGRADLVVVGTDGVPTAINAVRNGEMAATITPFPFYQGYWALEAAARLVAGQSIPLWVETPDEIITRANVDEFFDPQGSAKPSLFKD